MAPPIPAPPPPESALFRHRQLAPVANVRVSPICLGAMGLGMTDADRLGACTKETAFEILDNFTKLGGNFIDTASGYQSGGSEKWLGEWMKERGNRDEIVLATKYSGPFQRHKKEKIQSNFGGNGSKSMRLSVEKSLERLQTNYIDLYYVHWWDYATTIPELMHGLNDLVTSGKVLYLGISDTPAWIVSKANQYARDHGLRQFAVYQGLWNAAVRDFEREIIPMCRDEGMGIAPWGAVGGGKFQTEAAFQEREKNNPGRQGQVSTKYKAISKTLEEIGKAKGAGVHGVALQYVLQKTPYVFPIIGTRTVEHVTSSAEYLKIPLADEDIAKIDAASEFDPGFPHTFLSGTQFDDGPQEVPHGPKDVWLTSTLGTFDWVEETKPIRLDL